MSTKQKEQTVWLNQAQYAGISSLGLEEGIRSEIRIEKKIGNYRIKIADCLEELFAALSLRHQVFFGEGGAVAKSDSSLDMDEFDLVADHLILIDDLIGEVIGTYRLIRSSRTDRFYSQGEFEMEKVVELPGAKLELGRACVHKDYRNGAAIALVWQGLGEYLKKTQTRWMFGCSSLNLTTVDEAHGVGASLLKKFQFPGEQMVSPLSNHPEEVLRFQAELNGNFEFLEAANTRYKIPPLLKGYLSAGAGICGSPSWDPDFNTLDFFTLMDVDQMNPDFVRRFGVR